MGRGGEWLGLELGKGLGRGCGLLGGVKGAPEKVPAVNQVLKGRKEGSHRSVGQQVSRSGGNKK